jgi:hypothetical protein
MFLCGFTSRILRYPVSCGLLRKWDEEGCALKVGLWFGLSPSLKAGLHGSGCHISEKVVSGSGRHHYLQTVVPYVDANRTRVVVPYPNDHGGGVCRGLEGIIIGRRFGFPDPYLSRAGVSACP